MTTMSAMMKDAEICMCKFLSIYYLFLHLILFSIMKYNWLHSVLNEKSLWCWSSQQTKTSWSLIFRKRNFMMSCLRFLCTFQLIFRCLRERIVSYKNNIIFYDDNNDIDINNLWASFLLAKWKFLMFADWSAYTKKSKRARILRTKNFGVAVEKSTRGQMEDERVTMWWISLQFFFLFSLSFSLAITQLFHFSCTYSLLAATYQKH